MNATNACSLNELVAIFAEDAIVNDQLQEHSGKAAIGEWAESEIIADRVTIFVVSVIEHNGRSIVTAHVDGDFDKRGYEGGADVAKLPEDEQRAFVRAVLRRELGVMTSSAFVVAVLAARAQLWL